MGLIVGLLIGLALALAVALYVAKVPSPFVNKVQQRTADQDAAEAEKNRNWDPNTPLYGKNPARPNTAAASGVVPPPGTGTDTAVNGGAVAPSGTFGMAPPAASGVSGASAPGRGASSTRDPAAILADRTPRSGVGASNGNGTSTSTSDAVGSTLRPGTDPFAYYLQVGAFSRTEDAEEQRARVAMMGFTAKVYEREQSGRTVFRVRVGPYDRKEDADTAKERLDAASVESALVRVQK